MWTILKVFIESVTRLLLFYVLAFWPRGRWDLNSLPGIKPSPPTLEGELLTTGPPGKSLKLTFFPAPPRAVSTPNSFQVLHFFLWHLFHTQLIESQTLGTQGNLPSLF